MAKSKALKEALKIIKNQVGDKGDMIRFLEKEIADLKNVPKSLKDKINRELEMPEFNKLDDGINLLKEQKEMEKIIKKGKLSKEDEAFMKKFRKENFGGVAGISNLKNNDKKEEKSLWEKYKELIGIREEPTEEQKAEFERVKAGIEAQGLKTGEAAPITGEDLADFITTFGAGGALKLGTKTVGRSKLAREAGEQVLEVGEQVGKQVGKKTINLLNKVDKEVEKFSKETVKHLAKKYKTAGDISIRVGSKGGVGVSQTFKPNGKNMKLLNRIGNKIFSKNTIKHLGGTAAIGSIMLSIWAKAEATESMSYAVMKPAMDRGTFTGDWSIYNEAVAARDEILDQNILEKIGNFMPFWGAIQNIYLPGGKADAIKTAFEFQDRLATAGMEEELTPEEIQNKSREELIREQLDTETNPQRRIQLMEDLEWIEKSKEKEREKEEGLAQEARIAADIKQQEEEARRKKEIEERQKFIAQSRTQVGLKGLTQTPYEEKKREVPSKLGFGL